MALEGPSFLSFLFTVEERKEVSLASQVSFLS
jgi:hypothetical protein